MQALVIQHLPGEDLGNLKSVLENRGFNITVIRVWKDSFKNYDPITPDLLVVLGGPIGVYNTDTYPVLEEEIAFIKKRTVNNSLATLGICLGSQLIAHTLGFKVFKGPEFELGWKEIQIHNKAGYDYFLALDNMKVLHWHGDTFEFPAGFNLLASSKAYPNQAYISPNHKILGLQFHLEVNPEDFEGWLITSAGELLENPENIKEMRSGAQAFGKELQPKALKFWNQWLDTILSDSRK